MITKIENEKYVYKSLSEDIILSRRILEYDILLSDKEKIRYFIQFYKDISISLEKEQFKISN